MKLNNFFSYCRQLPIKYHLMAWFSLLFTIILSVVGLLTYAFVDRSLHRSMTNQLVQANTTIIDMIETTAQVTIRNHLRVSAENNLDIIDMYHRKVQEGTMTLAEAQHQAETILLSQRIGDSGYIYAINSDGVLMVHPRAGMKMQNMSTHPLAISQVERKWGYLEYDWQNPGDKALRNKALYMVYFQPWDWIVSVTSYRDELNSLIAVNDFARGLTAFKSTNDGRSYLISYDGRILAQSMPDQTVTPTLGAQLLQKIRNTRNDQFVFQQPLEQGGKSTQLVEVQAMPAYDWLVVSTIPLDTELQPLTTLRLACLVIFVAALGLILPVSLFISSRITQPLTNLARQLTHTRDNSLDIVADPTSLGEVGTLARHFNMYLENLRDSYSSLENEVRYRARVETQLTLFAKVFENALEGIAITTAEGTIIAVNDAFTKITGYAKEEALGENPRILKSDRHDPSFYQEMWRSLRQTGSWTGEIWNRRKNGEAYPEILSINNICNAQGETTHFVAVFHDISDMKQQEELIRYQADHDVLTGLPNRSLAYDRLEMAILHARRSGEQVGLFFLDLDNFKNINDSLGHAMGDKLLQLVAKRLVGAVRQEDTVARLGGDEFLIIAVDIKSERDLMTFAEKLLHSFAQPFMIESHELFTTASIGITLFPDDGRDITGLIRHADVAMYQSKQSGRNTYSMFTAEMSRRAISRMHLEKDFRQAIKNENFLVYYQPKIDTISQRITGLEALVRWQKADGTLVSPVDFIPLAEETGLIMPLGEIILDQSCRAMAWLKDHGYDHLRVAVNLSPVQFKQQNLVDTILATLEANGVAPSQLELEITETTMMTDLQDCVAKLNLLMDEQISIAIDDFGTGYSSLYYLKNMPISTIKIDRSFIRDITRDRDDAKIVETIILMAKNLGIGVVAEGVETRQQLQRLRAFQCDQVQGYYFSRPLSFDDICQYVNDHEREKAAA